MADSGKLAATQPAGFWKIRHAVFGLGALLLAIVAVRSCGGGAEDEKREAGSRDAIPRTSIAVKIPAPPAAQWQGQYPPGQQQAYQPPTYPQQQQPTYRYQGQQQQQPAYGYSAQQQQPTYGYPAQQQQPAYGYPAQQPQRALPATDPGNPWAVVQQPAYSYGAQQAPQQPWGQNRRQPPAYSQPSGSGQYRPLDEKPRTAQQSRSAPAATGRPAAPYDRRAGSSFGGNGSSYPYSGGYRGYYGGTPYGVPQYGGGWPGSGGPGYW